MSQAASGSLADVPRFPETEPPAVLRSSITRTDNSSYLLASAAAANPCYPGAYDHKVEHHGSPPCLSRVASKQYGLNLRFVTSKRLAGTPTRWCSGKRARFKPRRLVS